MTFDLETHALSFLEREDQKMAKPLISLESVLLEDGRILVAGGIEYDQWSGEGLSSASAQIFDPQTLTFSAPLTSTMSAPRADRFVGQRLKDGRVLFAGGYTRVEHDNEPLIIAASSSADLFDPTSNEFHPPQGIQHGLSEARFQSASVMLPSGDILIIGGYKIDPETNEWVALSSTEKFVVYDQTVSFTFEFNEGPVSLTIKEGKGSILDGVFNPERPGRVVIEAIDGKGYKASAVITVE